MTTVVLTIEDIEITEEMIEAGIVHLVEYNPEFDSDEDTVLRIFGAMIRARPDSGGA